MKWIKAPDELKALLERAMEGKPCQKRPMFGYPAYFANGYMCFGLFQDKVFGRLSPQQQAALSRTYGTIPALEPMPGRPMKDYFVLPEKAYRDPSAFGRIIDGALKFAEGLPAKAKKGAPKKRPPKGAKKG